MLIIPELSNNETRHITRNNLFRLLHKSAGKR